MSSRRLIPSTSMLAAFEAAARTGSFSDAARELNLTQGAISRQIHKLEEQLNAQLFRRDRQRVSLTDAGRTYAQDIGQALDIIRAASLNLMADPLGGAFSLAILPTFGTRWLIPRLPDFVNQNPRITINFFMKLERFDFAEERLDAAIHYGKPDWVGADCTFLLGEEVMPVCSPEFLAQHPIGGPEDLREMALLHISTRPGAWREWFAHVGLEADAQPQPGMHFEQFATAAQAAVAGLGVALMPTFLIKAETESGLLVPALQGGKAAGRMKSSSAYYFVTPHSKSKHPSVSAFRKWLQKQAKLVTSNHD